MFNRKSRPTITESVVELAQSGIESADFDTADSAANPLKIGLWVQALRVLGNTFVWVSTLIRGMFPKNTGEWNTPWHQKRPVHL